MLMHLKKWQKLALKNNNFNWVCTFLTWFNFKDQSEKFYGGKMWHLSPRSRLKLSRRKLHSLLLPNNDAVYTPASQWVVLQVLNSQWSQSHNPCIKQKHNQSYHPALQKRRCMSTPWRGNGMCTPRTPITTINPCMVRLKVRFLP